MKIKIWLTLFILSFSLVALAEASTPAHLNGSKFKAKESLTNRFIGDLVESDRDKSAAGHKKGKFNFRHPIHRWGDDISAMSPLQKNHGGDLTELKVKINF